MAAARGPAAQVARRLVDAPAISSASPTLAYMNARSAQAIRQKKRVRERERAREATRERRKIFEVVNERRADVRNERRARREDWELGALAPSRHLMDERGASVHGALTYSQASAPPVLATQRKDWGIEVGDRVVIIRRDHRDCGKIGKVLQVQYDTQRVTIERLDVSNIEFPEEFVRQESDKTPFRPQERPVRLADVRLVLPLFDAEVDNVRDCVIEEVRVVPGRNKHGQRLPKRRFVANTHPPLEIPYAPEREGAEYDGDTLRIEVEERSWTPTLSEPPMPASVINELRNPYSKFRTHHDPAWLAARDAEHFAAAEERARKAARMITPLEERRLANAAAAEAEPQELDEATLEKIGALMARNLKLDHVEGTEVSRSAQAQDQ